MQLLAVDLQVKNVNHKNVRFLIKATFECIVNIQKMMQNEKELTTNNFQRNHIPACGQSIYL